MHYAFKLKDPNKGRRKPLRHWIMITLPILIVASFVGSVLMGIRLDEKDVSEIEDRSYVGQYDRYIIVDTFVSYDDTREHNAYYVVIENPNTYEEQVIEVPENRLVEYNIGDVYKDFKE